MWANSDLDPYSYLLMIADNSYFQKPISKETQLRPNHDFWSSIWVFWLESRQLNDYPISRFRPLKLDSWLRSSCCDSTAEIGGASFSTTPDLLLPNATTCSKSIAFWAFDSGCSEKRYPFLCLPLSEPIFPKRLASKLIHLLLTNLTLSTGSTNCSNLSNLDCSEWTWRREKESSTFVSTETTTKICCFDRHWEELKPFGGPWFYLHLHWSNCFTLLSQTISWYTFCHHHRFERRCCYSLHQSVVWDSNVMVYPKKLVDFQISFGSFGERFQALKDLNYRV